MPCPQMGYLAAKTETIEIGSAILNVFSRTATCMAQTAAGLDFVSGGRFILGLGASGPQVIEGFHGVPVREADAANPRLHQRVSDDDEAREGHLRRPDREGAVARGAGHRAGQTAQDHQPSRARHRADLLGEPDGPVGARRPHELADGWIPIFFDPEKFHTVWGDDLKAGQAERDPELGQLQISAGGMVAIGDELVGDKRVAILDFSRPNVALYVGGMGARDKNFYNTICQKYGYVQEAAEIQDLYLDGKKEEAAAAVPAEMLEKTNLVGPTGYVKERLAAYKEAGVTHLSVSPVGGDPVKTVEQLKALL